MTISQAFVAAEAVVLGILVIGSLISGLHWVYTRVK
jgi:hypothetical protein